MARRVRDEAGVGTVAGVLLLAVVLTIGVTAAAVIGLVGVHRRAAAAADLAALAGAQAMAAGDPGCAAARRIGRRNGARVTLCRELDRDLLVEVSIPSPRWLGHRLQLRGRARAGPVEGSPGLVPSAGQ